MNPLLSLDSPMYSAWLTYRRRKSTPFYPRFLVVENGVGETAATELREGLFNLLGARPVLVPEDPGSGDGVVVDGDPSASVQAGGYRIQYERNDGRWLARITGHDALGCLYGSFAFLSQLQQRQDLSVPFIVEDWPRMSLRMLDHWDNLDGTIERGYAGSSIFFRDGMIDPDPSRLTDYARLVASIGINAVCINNVNVHEPETRFLAPPYLERLRSVANRFRAYGLHLYLSVNFASPMILGGLLTADPLDPTVAMWWQTTAERVYSYIPNFGGFVVKADSEFRPGPFTYGRSHVDGASVIANALAPFHGTVVWRCFVYNAQQDWRDKKIDRARAAYEFFQPLDGRFPSNVFLQVKNGPMDFQVREPVSPLMGALPKTSLLMEVQITQEYTGQQRDLFYLVPFWKEVLDFTILGHGEATTVGHRLMQVGPDEMRSGMVGVANVGDDPDWTGHPLAQANLYGFGRLAWNPQLSEPEITREWVARTFGWDILVNKTLETMLTASGQIYEAYTSPLGVGWMVNPGHHYGPNVDGYEYSQWGTYHYADSQGMGVDRTRTTGTGYVAQYQQPWRDIFESPATCPESLLLFFHHVPYTHRLQSGKTVIQHIYDSHFEGAANVDWLISQWDLLKGHIDIAVWNRVFQRLQQQRVNAREWCDVVTTYFWRKSGIPDRRGRLFY